MLIYHPAFDPSHCIFRVLRLLHGMAGESFQVERIRILDFYLLFPQTLKAVTFPRGALHFRRSLTGSENHYENIQDPRRIFARLEPYQTTALKHLAAYGLIDSESLAEGKVQRTDMPIPTALIDLIEKANSAEVDAMNLLTGPFHDIDLHGKSGLKARTQLFEHRYDPS